MACCMSLSFVSEQAVCSCTTSSTMSSSSSSSGFGSNIDICSCSSTSIESCSSSSSNSTGLCCVCTACPMVEVRVAGSGQISSIFPRHRNTCLVKTSFPGIESQSWSKHLFSIVSLGQSNVLDVSHQGWLLAPTGRVRE